MPCTLAVFPREPADGTASAQGRPLYRPRKPEASPLWQLVANHAHTFLDLSAVSWGLFRRDGSFLPVEGAPDAERAARLFRHQVLRMPLPIPEDFV